MKILVIGSHGFIGSHLVCNLLERKHDVFGIDNLNIYSLKDVNFYFENLKLRRELLLNKLEKFEKFDSQIFINLEKIINSFRPEVVINLGGNSVADSCKKNTDDAVKSIYDMNANILEILKNYNNIKYIYISSSMTYGNFDQDLVNENSNQNPIDPYGAIKLGGEHLVKSFNHQFGLKYLIIRPSAVYGPMDANMRVSGIFLYNAFSGKPLKVMDVKERLDFTYIKDLVDGLTLAIEKNKIINETFNMTTGNSRTISEFAHILHQINPKIIIDLKANQEDQMPGLKRPKRGTLDITKARKLLDYNPKYSLEDGINEYYKFFEEYLKKYFNEKN